METCDIFPTLCELAGLKVPEFAAGKSLNPFLKNPNTEGHAAIAYRSSATTIRSERYRLIIHNDGGIELYDHLTADGETKNIADDNPQIVDELSELMNKKLTNK